MSEALSYALDDARARFYEPPRSEILAAQKAARAAWTPKAIQWLREQSRQHRAAQERLTPSPAVLSPAG